MAELHVISQTLLLLWVTTHASYLRELSLFSYLTIGIFSYLLVRFETG